MLSNGFIAVEGPIGVGKTSLARQLAARLEGSAVCEFAEENPFLSEFYKRRKAAAFQTQIFFLVSRYTQQKQLANRDLFSGAVVSDYLFDKDRIFAALNLDEQEYALYDRVASAMETEIARPDLVIYLTATVESLLERIRKRGREYEKSIDRGYLQAVCESYSDYFFHYDESPLLVVKTDGVDFAGNKDNFEYLVDKVLSEPDSTEYIAFDSLNLSGN